MMYLPHFEWPSRRSVRLASARRRSTALDCGVALSQQMADWMRGSDGTEGFSMKENVHPRLTDCLLPEMWRGNVSSIRAQ